MGIQVEKQESKRQPDIFQVWLAVYTGKYAGECYALERIK